MKIKNLQVQQAEHKKKKTPRPITIKLLKPNDNEKIIRAARGKKDTKHTIQR